DGPDDPRDGIHDVGSPPWLDPTELPPGIEVTRHGVGHRRALLGRPAERPYPRPRLPPVFRRGSVDVGAVEDPSLLVHDAAVVPVAQVYPPDVHLRRELGPERLRLVVDRVEAGALHDADFDATAGRLAESLVECAAHAGAELALELGDGEVGL